jgi:PAS domain S-box-containing protein
MREIGRCISQCLNSATKEYDPHLEGNFRALYKSVPVGFAITSADTGVFLRVNPAFCEIVGYAEEELLRMTYWDLTPASYRPEEFEQIEHLRREGGYGPYEKEYICKNGQNVPVLLSGVALTSTSGKEIVWSVIQDISKRKEAEAAVYRLAYYDSLTTLPNRTYFGEASINMLRRAQKNHTQCAMMVIDIDGFKRINDSLGHTFGDKLLFAIAHRLEMFIKNRCDHDLDTEHLACSTDAPCECFCSRLGGDEFALMFERVVGTAEAHKIGDELLNEFDSVFDIEGRQIDISVSIGISMYPKDGEDISTMLRSADLALYAAKSEGKNRYVFHHDSMTTRVSEYVHYENALRWFIETEQFEMFFQPIFSIDRERIEMVETLFRGNPDQFGPLNLDKLFGVAEESGLIIALGAKIFKKACEYCVQCVKLGPTRKVSINISPRQLEQDDFVEMYSTIMEETGINPSNVALEITESALMEDFNTSNEKLLALQQKGVTVVIDDFGKGYSSMMYLKRLPARKLKIDMSFTRDVVTDRTTYEIVKGITLLAHAIDMRVCAEGVETEEQLTALKQLGVDEIQGYLIARPMPFDHFRTFVTEYLEDE